MKRKNLAWFAVPVLAGLLSAGCSSADKKADKKEAPKPASSTAATPAKSAAKPAEVKPKATAAAPTTSKATDPKLVYAAGVAFGQRVREGSKEEGHVIDEELLVKGLRDGLNDKPKMYSEADMEQAIAKVEAMIRQKRIEALMAGNPKFKKMVEETLAASKTALEENAAHQGVEVLPNGLQIKVLKEGDGRIVANAKTVTANFKVSLMDGTLVTESVPDKPSVIPLRRVLPAVVQAIHGMKVGSTWRIAVPPEHAFGLAGKPPAIGPNEALMFDVELLAAE